MIRRLLLLLPLLAGCVTPDSLMRKSLARGTADEAGAAADLAAYAADRGRPAGLRAWALRALSRLRRVSPASLQALGSMMADQSDDPAVRSWAAWALGEMRRKEAVPHFLAVLDGPLDRTTGYFVLEGLTKLVSAIVADTRVNDQVLQSMNTFASRQKEFPPDMYDLLSESITNLTVLTLVLSRIEKSARPEPVDVYTAVYRVLRHLAQKKQTYLASYADNTRAISEAFRLSFASLDRAGPLLEMLLGWYAGVLGDNKELAGLCAGRIATWTRKADPRLRLLVTWSLTRMELHHEQAREALVGSTLRRETDEQVLRLLGILSGSRPDPDKLQELLKVRVHAAGKEG